MDPVRRTKIVVTLGPASDGLEADLVRAGLDVARLNFSHGTPAEHARRCQAVRSAADPFSWSRARGWRSPPATRSAPKAGSRARTPGCRATCAQVTACCSTTA